LTLENGLGTKRNKELVMKVERQNAEETICCVFCFNQTLFTIVTKYYY